MGWMIAFRAVEDDENEAEDVQGIIVGTNDYVSFVVDLLENIDQYKEPKAWQ